MHPRLLAAPGGGLCACADAPRGGGGERTEIRAVLFDVGGVLSRDMIEVKLRDLARRHRLPEAELLRAGLALRGEADLGELSDPQYWEAVLRRVGVDPVARDSVIEPYLEAIPGTLELARRLKARGLRVGILSNDSVEMARARRTRHGLDAVFDPIVVSGEIGKVKPGRPIYDHAVERLGLPPSQVLFIDDREENVQGARAAGLRALRFEDAGQLEADLARLGLL